MKDCALNAFLDYRVYKQMEEVYLDSFAKRDANEIHLAYTQLEKGEMRDRESSQGQKMNDGKGLLDGNLYHSLEYSHIRGNLSLKPLLGEIYKSNHKRNGVCTLSNFFIEFVKNEFFIEKDPFALCEFFLIF